MKDYLFQYQIAKFTNYIHYIPIFSGSETPGSLMFAFMLLQRHLGTITDHLPRIVEVGSYGGRLSLALACAVLETEARLTLVDDFKGLKVRDRDELAGEWQAFYDIEVKSGMDMHAWVQWHLAAIGSKDNVEIVRADPESVGKSWGKTHKDKIDMIFFANFPDYKRGLEWSNAWLPWLRKGALCVFMDASDPRFAPLPAELVKVKQWVPIANQVFGPRNVAVLGRPRDDTSNAGVGAE